MKKIFVFKIIFIFSILFIACDVKSSEEKTKSQAKEFNEQQKLTASDKDSGDEFGCSVAVDGNDIVVGVHQEDSDGKTSNGAVYVFTKNGDTWSQSQKLTASNKDDHEKFGNSVAVDSGTIVVGAFYENSGGKDDNGVVYVFTKSGDTWSQSQKLTASDKDSGDEFGSSVAIDGNNIVVGAPEEDSGGKDNNGAVYVFTKSGDTWSQSQKLTVSDRDNDDYFGWSVAIDGDNIIVGASEKSSDGKDHNGVVYVFTKSGNTWSQSQKLTASDKDNWDNFGYSAAIDGETTVVGAYREDSGGKDNNGAVYVFTKSGDIWSQSQKLTASDKDDVDKLGTSVAMKNSTVAIGAIEGDSDGKTNNGAVYIFTKSGDTWSQSQKLTASDKDSGDWLGYSVAIEGSTVVIGAAGESSDGKFLNGAVYVYKK